jgi:hypothetical protein
MSGGRRFNKRRRRRRRPSYRKSLQLLKKNIQYFNTIMRFINFFVGHFCPPGSESGSSRPKSVRIHASRSGSTIPSSRWITIYQAQVIRILLSRKTPSSFSKHNFLFFWGGGGNRGGVFSNCRPTTLLLPNKNFLSFFLPETRFYYTQSKLLSLSLDHVLYFTRTSLLSLYST